MNTSNGCSQEMKRLLSFLLVFTCFICFIVILLLHVILCAFFHAFLKGRMENGKDSNPVGRSYRKKFWFLIYLIIRDVWELNQLLELRVKASWQIYMQVSDCLEWESKYQLNTLKKPGESGRFYCCAQLLCLLLPNCENTGEPPQKLQELGADIALCPKSR